MTALAGAQSASKISTTRTNLLDLTAVSLRWIIAAVLLWSGIIKLRHPFDFLGNIYQYQLVSPQAGQLVSILIPWTETILGILLAGELFVDGALLCAAVLLAIFSAAQASVLIRGLKISCGCFGPVASGNVNYNSLSRATGLFLIAILALALRRISLNRASPPAPM